MSDSSASGGGVSFGGLLTILFVGLKLGHVIDWSWWWVLAPLWIGVVLAFAVFAVVFLIVTVRDR